MPFSLVLLVLLTNFGGQKAERPFIISGVPFYPFHYVDNGKPEGIFVTFVDQIFKEMKVPYEIKITSVAGFDEVKAGKIDAVMSVGYAKEPESFMIFPEGFSNPAPKNYVWVSNYHFYVKKDKESMFTFSKLSELKAKNPTIGVIKGISYHPDFWAEKFNVLEFDSNEENFKALSDGKIDLFLIDKTVGSAILKRDGLKGSLVALPNIVFSRYYTLVLSKASTYPNKERVFKQFFEGYEKLKITAEARNIFTRYMN